MAAPPRRNSAGEVSIAGTIPAESKTLPVGAVDNGDGTCSFLTAPGSGGGVVRTAGFVAASTGGTVTAGSVSVGFSSSSDFTGTIGGASFGASQALGMSAQGADTIGAITYTVSAGTLYIATLV